MEVWYILSPRDSELLPEAHMVVCKEGDRIAHLKDQVWAKNSSQLAGVDAPQLEVCENDEIQAHCDWHKEVSKCASGTVEKPFIIFYPRGQGTSLSPFS